MPMEKRGQRERVEHRNCITAFVLREKWNVAREGMRSHPIVALGTIDTEKRGRNKWNVVKVKSSKRRCAGPSTNKHVVGKRNVHLTENQKEEVRVAGETFDKTWGKWAKRRCAVV